MSKKVAVVEDEAELASLIEYNLNRGGFQTRIFTGADGTFRDLETFQPDLIVLDVMLPGQDGFELCRRIRQGGKLARTPVIFLTARSDEVDPRELVARIKAHLRRSDTESEPRQTHLTMGPFRIDVAARRVFQSKATPPATAPADVEIELTSTEFKLLEFFLNHPGRAWSREELLREVWGEQHFVTPRTVDVHIRRLREQIESKPDEPAFLVTVRGFGYRFEAQ